MKANVAPIIISHKYKCDTQTLWNAITDPNEMRKWYFDALPDFRPEIGFYTSFLLINEGRKFTHQFKVLDVILGEMIQYTFSFAEYNGDGHVKFEIAEDGDSSVLTLTDIVTKPYPEDIPEFKRESGKEGWTYFLKERLEPYINSKDH